jgi:hypothetical protein
MYQPFAPKKGEEKKKEHEETVEVSAPAPTP